MAAIVLTLSVTALVAGPTLAVKVRAACEQLGIAAGGLTVPAALKACNEAKQSCFPTARGTQQSNQLSRGNFEIDSAECPGFSRIAVAVPNTVQSNR